MIPGHIFMHLVGRAKVCIFDVGLGGKDGYIGGREGMRILRSVQIQHFGRK